MLNKKKKQLLREFVDFTCEQCKKTELELSQKDKIIKLQIHRINRGMEYVLRNIKVLCPKCHKMYHYKEFQAT